MVKHESCHAAQLVGCQLRGIAELNIHHILSGMTPDPSTVQLVNDGLKHAESFPITIGFFILIGMFAGFFYWLLFRFYPVYRDEQEKNRLAREIEGEKTRNHLAQILAARDEKAAAAIADERSAGQQRHTEIVKEIGESVEKLHEKTDTTHRHLTMVLAKLGVTTVLVVCLSLSFMLGRLTVSQLAVWKRSNSAPPTVLLAESCSPPCPNGEYCCGKSARGADHQGCCEEKSGTAGSQMTCVEPTPKTDGEQSKRSMPTPPLSPSPQKPVSYGVGHERLARAHFADATCSRRIGCL